MYISCTAAMKIMYCTSIAPICVLLKPFSLSVVTCYSQPPAHNVHGLLMTPEELKLTFSLVLEQKHLIGHD